jgi:chaperone modulatory protein CbpM
MTQLPDIHLPDFYLSFEELCLSANISRKTLFELVDQNIVVPFAGSQPPQWQFHVTCVMQVKKAVRLYRDLEINWSDLALVLNLLDEINQLNNEIFQLKQQLSRFSAYQKISVEN